MWNIRLVLGSSGCYSVEGGLKAPGRRAVRRLP